MNQEEYRRELLALQDQISSQDILEIYGITEYTAEDILKEFETAVVYKEEQARIFRILDAADKSEIWKTYNKPLPAYTQTPTVNLITIIKEATLASVMPTSYAGEFRPYTLEARELAKNANRFMQVKWEASKMDKVNQEAGAYGFLHGTSGVLFGWQTDIVDAQDLNSSVFNKVSNLQAKTYHPNNIFPDPTADRVEEMRYLFFSEIKSKDFLMSIPRFAHVLNTIENSYTGGTTTTTELVSKDAGRNKTNESVTFITAYKKVLRQKQHPTTGEMMLMPSVDIVYMAGRQILDVSRDIQPSEIPFVPFYDERLPNQFWGISRCQKVLSLVVALNQLDSIEATAYFQNQNPAEFINALAGINVPEYQKNRNNPASAFTVNIDPRLVQTFAQRPDIPKTIDGFRSYLLMQIQNVSGVDSAYLGKSYGSIQTTGGVQQAIDRATMRDTNRIKEIDEFITREIELMLKFFVYNGGKERLYVQPNPIAHEQEGQEIEFDPIQLINRQDIAIEVSNAAPRSHTSYEEGAMKIFELQMKYNPRGMGYPDLITPEEFVGWLNIPKAQKNILLERMRNQSENMKLEEYMMVVSALGTLTEGGMEAEMALQEIAKMVQASKIGQLPADGLGLGSNGTNSSM